MGLLVAQRSTLSCSSSRKKFVLADSHSLPCGLPFLAHTLSVHFMATFYRRAASVGDCHEQTSMMLNSATRAAVFLPR